MARSHACWGVVAGSWTGCALSAVGVPGGVCLAAGIVTAGGSFVPDCDHHNAKITVTLGWIGWLLSRAARLFGGHRGWTHTAFGCSIMGVLTAFGCLFYPEPITSRYWWAFGLAMAAGCLSHVLSDMATTQGCDLWWLPGRRFNRWCIVPYPIGTQSDDEKRLYLRYYRPLAYISVIAAIVVAAAL